MVVFFQTLLFLFLVVLSLFMILIILLQRGKGGGLVGAFGGMGGQSAFGIKSSDVFLRITVVAAIIWFVVCIGGRYLLEMQTKTTLVDENNVSVVATDSDATSSSESNPQNSDAPTVVPVTNEASAENEAAPTGESTPVNEPVPPVSTETAPSNP